ncbi:serpin family protein [Nonomuraea sp. NPDC049028]|uniref:serpin family protein n=1 Tax=Nonomuraea sp. NPDC049028 TaxID=3364348 RepID=UPI00371742F6
MSLNGRSQKDLAAAVNALTARWATTCSGESAVMSGVGAWPLLAYLATAADGPGRAELQDAIGMDATAAAPAARAVLAALNASPAIKAALGLWTRHDLPLRPTWAAALPAGMRGELTGDTSADQLQLDAWAARQTDGAIPTMPVSVTEETLLVLASALTVRTTWLRPFTEGATLVEAGPWVDREIVVLRRSTRVLNRVQVADTPAGPLTMFRVMGTGGIDVHLLLGHDFRKAADVLTAGIDALAKRYPSVDADVLPARSPGPGINISAVPAYEPDDLLTVTVPRFTVTASLDLLALPDVFGLATVTNPARGHFPGISTEPLAIAQARQNATATFQAHGFEAAAVTAMGAIAAGIAPRPPYRARRVDVDFTRPFGFLAVDRRSRLILTAGWVAEPETEHPEEL